jgi:uncharacterized delta-60 repeat protein
MSIVSLLRRLRSHLLFAPAVLLALAPVALRAQSSVPSSADGFDPNVDGIVYAVTVQTDGKLLVAGKFSTVSPNGSGTPVTRNNLARFNADGSLDTGFNPNVNNQINALALQPDGRIVIGGIFTSVGGAARSCVARLNADGSLDTGLNATFSNSPAPAIYAVAVQPDGKVVVGGSFTAIVPAGASTATVRNRIARFNADGSLDTGYNPNANATVYSLAAQTDGRIVLGGLFTTLQPSGDAVTRNHIARLNADGSIDGGFDPNSDASVMVLTLQNDGKILLGGFFTQLAPNGADPATGRSRMARLNADGSLDTAFNPRPTSNVTAIAVQPDGRIVVGGLFTNIAGVTHNYLARLEASGVIDTTFDAGINYVVNAIAPQTDGKIVIGGNFTQLRTASGIGAIRNHVARLEADGGPDVNFDPNISGRIGVLVAQSDGKVVFGGTFAAAGGLARNNLARSNADGTIDTGFNPDVNGTVTALALQSDGKILVGGNFSAVGGVARNFFARLNADGSLDTAFDPNPNGQVMAIAVRSDGKILLGGFFAGLQPNGATETTAQSYLALVNADGSLDTGFKPLFNGEILALQILSDGRILAGGNFIALQPNGGGLFPNTQSFIIRMSAAGIVDQTFSPSPDNKIESFAVQADGKIVIAGIFSNLQPNPLAAPVTRNRIARLNADGTLDTGFDPNLNGEARAVVVLPDGKIMVGGGFFSLKPNGATDAITRSYLARLNADGTVDAAFDAHASGAVNALLLQGDGKLLVGGAFNNLQPPGSSKVIARTHLARLNGDGSLDTSYDPTFANAPGNSVRALAIQTDGNILLGGSFGKLAGSTGDNLVRFKSDGSLDFSFNPGVNGPVNAIAVQTNKGTVVTQGNGFAWLGADGLPRPGFTLSSALQISGEVVATAVQADGSIILAGNFTNSTGATGGNLARITANGTLDTSFNPNPNGRVSAIIVQPDGKILISGAFTTLQPNGAATTISRNRIARLNPDGTVDSFDPNANDQVNAMVLLPDGKILLGGVLLSLQPNGSSTVQGVNRLARVNADGTMDASFTPVFGDIVYSLAVQSDGKILVGGQFSTIGSTNRAFVVRLNADGTLDDGFDPKPNGPVLALKVQPDGNILMGGSFTTIGGWLRLGVARVFPNGANDPDFEIPVSGVVSSIVLQPNGQFVIGGSFTSVGDSTRNNIARINANATLDRTFNPNISAQVDTVTLLSDGSLLASGLFTSFRPFGVVMIGGSFTQVSGAALSNLILLNEDGNATGAFQPNPNGAVNALLVQSDGRILVGGAFTTISGVARGGMARYNTDGSLDGSFNPNVGGTVNALALQTDGRILIGGTFTSVGGAGHNRLARLNADGSVDGSFNPDVNDAVNVLVEQPDGSVLVGGAFTSVGGAGRNRLARVASGGSVDGSFNPNVNGTVDALALQADGSVILAGAFTSVGGTTRNNLARVTSTGAVDAAFDPSADGEVSALVLQPDGKPLIGGSFARVGGQARYRFARLSPTAPALQSISVNSDVTTVTWNRSGTSPELAWATFEQSSDGANWTALGQGTRGAGGSWQIASGALPKNAAFLIRGRGALASSQYSSSGLIETVWKFYPPLSLSGTGSDNSGGGQLPVAQFSADGLPSGLAVDSATGMIYGAPADGTYQVTLNATTSTGTTSATQTLVFGSAAAGARTRPINTSTRAFVSDGHPLFVGFIVTGPESKTVLLRGVGPTLSVYNVPNPLAVPHLKLFDHDGKLLLENDGWANNASLAAGFDRIGTFPFISGSTDAAMFATLSPGDYTIQIVASPGASGVALAEVYDAGTNQSTETSRFGNVSARGPSAGLDNPLICGFVIGGTAPKRLLVRGVGPGLLGYGVTDALSDPIVGVYDQVGHLIAQNDNWVTPRTVDASQPAVDAATVSAATTTIGTFTLDPASKDSAVVITLPPGLYTVQVGGVNGVTGSALAEVYELP